MKHQSNVLTLVVSSLVREHILQLTVCSSNSVAAFLKTRKERVKHNKIKTKTARANSFVVISLARTIRFIIIRLTLLRDGEIYRTMYKTSRNLTHFSHIFQNLVEFTLMTHLLVAVLQHGLLPLVFPFLGFLKQTN